MDGGGEDTDLRFSQWLDKVLPEAYRAGLKPLEIGELTPGEILALIKAHEERLVMGAWWRENFSRKKRLQRLDYYLKPTDKKKDVKKAREDYSDLKAMMG